MEARVYNNTRRRLGLALLLLYTLDGRFSKIRSHILITKLQYQVCNVVANDICITHVFHDIPIIKD